MEKEKKKFVRRKIGWILLRVNSSLIQIVPFRFTMYLGRVFGLLAYFFARRHRKIALEGLGTAFSKEKTSCQIRKIARKCFEFIGETAWEILYFLNRRDLIKERVDIVGKDNLVKALEKKKGVIALGAHFGNFPLMCLRLKEEGFVVNTLARPMRDEKAGSLIHKLRTEGGIKTIFSYPRKESVFGSLRALSNSEILVIQMDQNFGTGGVWVKFFGRLAATPVGPIVLALRSGAAIVPMFIVRKATGRHTLFIEEQVELEERQDKEETILVNAVKLTKIIENWVRRYPELWGWIHRRWKSRPDKKVYGLKYKVQKI